MVGWCIQSNPFFVRSIDFLFSKLLTRRAILIYGDGLVGKIIDCMNKNSTIISF